MSEKFDPRTACTAKDELHGRVILITGAGSGIGRAVAVSCAGHGATVLLLGRNARQLNEVHAQITTECGDERATIVQFDLENALAGDYDALFGAIEQRYQRLDGCCTTPACSGSWRQLNTTMCPPGAGSCR